MLGTGRRAAVHPAAFGLVGDVVVQLAFDAEESLATARVAGLEVAARAVALDVLEHGVQQDATTDLEIGVVVGPLGRALPGHGVVLSVRRSAEPEREHQAERRSAHQRGLVPHVEIPLRLPPARFVRDQDESGLTRSHDGSATDL